MATDMLCIVLIGLLLVQVLKCDSEVSCKQQLNTISQKLKAYTDMSNSIYSLFPYMDLPLGSDRLQTACDVANDIRLDLKHSIYPKCDASQADEFIIKLAGWEHFCGAGQTDYNQFGSCIDTSRPTLRAACPLTHDSISDIKWTSGYGSSADVKSEMCSTLHKYIQCSASHIEKACGSSRAGQWYQSFITLVFEELDVYFHLGCSFGGIHFPLWAYFVVAVGVILLLWCTCRWLHVAGFDARACTYVFGDRCISVDGDKTKDKDRRSDESIPSYTKGLEIDNMEEIIQMRDPPLSEESLYPTVVDPPRIDHKYGNGHIGCSERVTVHRENI